MWRRRWITASITILLIVITAIYGITHTSISALPDPGPVETRVATEVRNWFVRRAARAPLAPEPTDTAESVSKGSAILGMACAFCHGREGRKPTAIGESMYPRTAPLGSPGVQALSNRELFWVVQNGIRLSGMPGFGKVLSDDHIWDVVHYLRTLPAARRTR